MQDLLLPVISNLDTLVQLNVMQTEYVVDRTITDHQRVVVHKTEPDAPFFREMLRYMLIAGAPSLLTQRPPVISRMEKSVEVEQESVILHGLNMAFRFYLRLLSAICFIANSILPSNSSVSASLPVFRSPLS